MFLLPIDLFFFRIAAPKSSPAFYEQKQRLERAKTGDYLKHKIQRRPQRDELVQQHILEQEVFDPSYYEQERKLKRARLADDLNERLSHRPGPLELIKGNILHADLSLEQAIKEGQITFKKTCEGEIIKNPPKRFVFEEESSSDSSTPSPSLNINQQCNRLTSDPFILSSTAPSSSLVSIPAIQTEPPPTTVSYIVTTNILPSSQPSNSTVFITTNPTTAAHSLVPSKNVASLQPPQVLSTATINSGQNFVKPAHQLIKSIHQPETNAQLSQPKSKSKKVKSKTTPKTRVIKFHEYTGPPSANSGRAKIQTGWTLNPTSTETSYELLLKQQQLILQWQLESQQQQQQQNSTNQQPIPAPKVCVELFCKRFDVNKFYLL